MKAAYIGSFDPITNGHIDVIKRAVKMYTHVYVAIGINPDKKCMFDIDLRIQFIKNALKLNGINQHSVTVTSFKGLAADFMYLNNIYASIRGIRNANDIEYESNMNLINKYINPTIDTVYIPCSPELQTVSSSSVKMLVESLVDISQLVPLEVKTYLEATILKTFFIGVVGISGSGKSTFIKNSPCYSIDYDNIVHQIWEGAYHDTELLRILVSSKMISLHQDIISTDSGKARIDKAILRKVIQDPEKNKYVREIMKPAIDYMYRKTLRMKLSRFTGKSYYSSWPYLRKLSNSNNQQMNIPTYIQEITEPILLDAPMLIEYGWLGKVNNNVIIVNTDSDVCVNRIMKRDGLTKKDAEARLITQLTSSQIESILKNEIDKTGVGNIIYYSDQLYDSGLYKKE